MGVVGGGKTPTGHEKVLGVLRDQGAEGNPATLTLREVSPGRIGAFMVVFNRGSTQGDLVVELPGCKNLVARDAVFAENAPGFPDADLGSEGRELGVLVTRDLVAEEAHVFDRLAPCVFGRSSHESYDRRPSMTSSEMPPTTFLEATPGV